MKKKSKFHLHYVEECTPKMVCFDTEKDMLAWIRKFKRIHKGNDDAWLDYSFKGEMLKAYDPYWKQNA